MVWVLTFGVLEAELRIAGVPLVSKGAHAVGQLGLPLFG